MKIKCKNAGKGLTRMFTAAFALNAAPITANGRKIPVCLVLTIRYQDKVVHDMQYAVNPLQLKSMTVTNRGNFLQCEAKAGSYCSIVDVEAGP